MSRIESILLLLKVTASVLGRIGKAQPPPSPLGLKVLDKDPNESDPVADHIVHYASPAASSIIKYTTADTTLNDNLP